MYFRRQPTTPGEILQQEYMQPMALTQKQLADHIGCDIKVINRIINNKVSLSTEVAFKLAAAFNTSPDFWLNAQQACEIYAMQKKLRKLPRRIKRIAKYQQAA